MPYEFYKILHLGGIFMIMLGLGAHLLNVTQGGDKKFAGRKLVGIFHGVGLLVTFVAGFGLMARLGYFSNWPTWIFGKIGVWLFFGAAMVVYRKIKAPAFVSWLLTLGVGILAIYLAQYKPGM